MRTHSEMLYEIVTAKIGVHEKPWPGCSGPSRRISEWSFPPRIHPGPIEQAVHLLVLAL